MVIATTRKAAYNPRAILLGSRTGNEVGEDFLGGFPVLCGDFQHRLVVVGNLKARVFHRGDDHGNIGVESAGQPIGVGGGEFGGEVPAAPAAILSGGFPPAAFVFAAKISVAAAFLGSRPSPGHFTPAVPVRLQADVPDGEPGGNEERVDAPVAEVAEHGAPVLQDVDQREGHHCQAQPGVDLHEEPGLEEKLEQHSRRAHHEKGEADARCHESAKSVHLFRALEPAKTA